LRDSLGGNSVTKFIITINPGYENLNETLSFAQRAAGVRTHAILNETVSLKGEHQALAKELVTVKQQLTLALSKRSQEVSASEREQRLELLLQSALERERETERKLYEWKDQAEWWEEQTRMHQKWNEACNLLSQLREIESDSLLYRQLIDNHPEKQRRVQAEKEIDLLKDENSDLKKSLNQKVSQILRLEQSNDDTAVSSNSSDNFLPSDVVLLRGKLKAALKEIRFLLQYKWDEITMTRD
jgi:hypothetical protein